MTDAIHKTKRGKYYINFLLRNSFISSFLILNFIIGSVYTDAQNVKTLEDRRFASCMPFFIFTKHFSFSF